MGEAGFAHVPDGHNAPGKAHAHTRIFQLLGGFLRIVSQNLRNGVREFEFAGISLLPERFNLFQLFAPQFVDLLVECQRFPYP